MLEILEKITAGQGTMEDLKTLEETAEFVKERSLCGLGKSAPLPVLSTIKNFRDEYLEHILEKKCRAHVCSALKTYVIDEEKCIGCTKCARNCPVDAISGKVKEAHRIDSAKCIKCGACMENCRFDAIRVQ
jgi:NADH-quinone oxidoreductase subunit F